MSLAVTRAAKPTTATGEPEIMVYASWNRATARTLAGLAKGLRTLLSPLRSGGSCWVDEKDL
jgi:hypothetical protein